MMNKPLYGMLLLAGVGLAACSSSRTASAKKPAKPFCASIPYASTEASVGWTRASRPDTARPAGAIPGSDQYYLLDTAALIRNLEALNSGQGERAAFSVPLPEPLGCQYFQLTRKSGPNGLRGGAGLIFEGTSLFNSGATMQLILREQLSATIRWDSTLYKVSAVPGPAGCYAVYRQATPLPQGLQQRLSEIKQRTNMLRGVHRGATIEK